jgi:hypothetical protein
MSGAAPAPAAVNAAVLLHLLLLPLLPALLPFGSATAGAAYHAAAAAAHPVVQQELLASLPCGPDIAGSAALAVFCCFYPARLPFGAVPVLAAASTVLGTTVRRRYCMYCGSCHCRCRCWCRAAALAACCCCFWHYCRSVLTASPTAALATANAAEPQHLLLLRLLQAPLPFVSAVTSTKALAAAGVAFAVYCGCCWHRCLLAPPLLVPLFLPAPLPLDSVTAALATFNAAVLQYLLLCPVLLWFRCSH